MPAFENPDYIRADQRVSEFHAFATAPLSFSRNDVDVDVSFTPRPFAALRVGYSRNGSTWENRIFRESVQDVVRASLDARGFDWLTVRGIVERSSRTGSGFRDGLLESFEEQPGMRHFDIADRDRSRVTALVQITPVPALAVSASASRGKDEYRDAELGLAGFGLQDYENRRYTASFDVTPNEQVSAGVWYVREAYEASQRSRTASSGAQFTDPLRDWMLNSFEKVDTVSVALDLRRLGSKVDVQFAYDTSRSTGHYIHSVVDSSLVGVPERLPPLRNTLDAATVDVLWSLTDRVGLGVLYRFDRYDVEDFTLDENTLTRLDLFGAMFMGYVYRPYTANGVWLRLNYRW
jgi:hypothetical protein